MDKKVRQENLSASQLLLKLIKENNLHISIGRPKISFTDDNTVIISPPQLVCSYLPTSKQPEKKKEDARPA